MVNHIKTLQYFNRCLAMELFKGTKWCRFLRYACSISKLYFSAKISRTYYMVPYKPQAIFCTQQNKPFVSAVSQNERNGSLEHNEP